MQLQLLKLKINSYFLGISRRMAKRSLLFLDLKFSLRNYILAWKYLSFSSCDKNLCVWFDANFSFTYYVHKICKPCFVQMPDIRQIRDNLTVTATFVANALVSSRLDHCNSLFISLSSFNIDKLQCIQNTLAMVATNCGRYTGIFPKDYTGCQLNTITSSKWPHWFISFFTVVIPAILQYFVYLSWYNI